MADKNFVAYGDAETILSEFAVDIKNKVDKISGKGLSSNDFTTAEKNKLAGIEVGADKTTVDTALSSTSENPLQNKAINSALSNKVDKVSGKGLSTNDYTTTEKNKLAGIASGAEVNVQSDWSVTTTTSDAYIKNKPTSLPASDVYSWAKASTKPSYTKSEIGLGNVDNTADADKTVSKANTLTTARYIDGISFDGSGDVNHFGICSTTASTTAKVVSVTGSPTLADGTRVIVRFLYANTASNPTLNVNSLGAKGIKLSNSSSSSAQGSNAGSTTWGAGYVLELVYANNYWIVVRGENATTSYDGLMSAADKTKLNGIATGAQVNSVTGVKGNSESSYRTGNINITKSNIGLGNVDNTADADKSVNYASSALKDSDGDVFADNYVKKAPYHSGSDPTIAQFKKFIAGFNTAKWGDQYIDDSVSGGHNQYLWVPLGNGAFTSDNNYGFYLRSPWQNGSIRVASCTNGSWSPEKILFDSNNCAVELDTTGTSNNEGIFFNNAIKFPNGLCIQWGRHTNMPNGTAVYFKYAYSYMPSVTFANGQGYATSISAMIWFDDGALSSNVDWMAIGYIS